MIKAFNRAITWTLAIAVVVLLVFAGFKHFRKPPPYVREMVNFKEMLKEAEPAFTAKESEAFLKDLIPLVEEAAGKKFKQTPRFKIIGRDELANVLIQDLLPQFTNLMPDANSKQILEMAEHQVESVTPTIIGKYGFVDRVIYLIPGNVYPVFKLNQINRKHTQAIVKILIAHELTHALQDQQIELKQKFDEIYSAEELEAFNATIEGHAVFIQDLVGKKMQLDEALFETSRMLAAGQLTFKESMLEIQQKMAEARYENIYLGGRNFVEYHYNIGGSRKVWDILAAPPADSAMILEPGTYDPKPKDKVDYAGLLKGVERYFGNKKWDIRNIEIPKMTLHASYTNLNPKEKDELISKIAHVQSLQLKLDEGDDLFGSVAIIIFKDNTSGPKLISIAEKMAKYNAMQLKNSKMYRMENLNFENFSGIDADEARKLSFTLKPAKGRSVQTAIVRIFIGNIVLEITDSNIGLKNERFNEIAELIFMRCRLFKLSPYFSRASPIDLYSELLMAA